MFLAFLLYEASTACGNGWVLVFWIHDPTRYRIYEAGVDVKTDVDFVAVGGTQSNMV